LLHNMSSSHSSYFSDEDAHLPLHLRGVISYINACYPSQKEIDMGDMTQITQLMLHHHLPQNTLIPLLMPQMLVIT
jgi:hypothetical protein